MSLCAAMLALATMFLTAACGGAGGKTQFRLMNAVPDLASLDVRLNSASVATNVAYGTSTGYQSVNSGSQQVAIEPSGSTSSLLQQAVTFPSGADTTILASNFSSSVVLLVLADDNSAPVSGDFKLRLVNSAPGLGAADIYVEPPGTQLSTVSPTVGNVAFNGVVNYQSLTGGSYEIMVTPVGQKFIVIDSGSLTFSAGQVRTFVALNSNGGFTYTMLQDLN
jgi:hypothetical protein